MTTERLKSLGRAALALWLAAVPVLPACAGQQEAAFEPGGEASATPLGGGQEQSLDAISLGAVGGVPGEDFTWKNDVAPSPDFLAEIGSADHGIPALPETPIASFSASDSREAGGSEQFNSESLSNLRSAKAAKKGKPLDAADLEGIFDGKAAGQNGDAAGLKPVGPQGLKGVTIKTVSSKEDIAALDWSYYTDARHMKRAFGRFLYAAGPMELYAYQDNSGKTFYGINLAKDPGVVDRLPIEEHEKRLIKRIQIYNSDMRLLINETGTTPDVVVGSEVVEMKSALTDGGSLRRALRRRIRTARRQLVGHAAAHGLRSLTAIAIDLSLYDEIAFPEVADVMKKLRNQDPALRKIYVFTRKNVMSFVRQKDGSFKIDSATPFSEASIDARAAARIAGEVSSMRLKLSSKRGRRLAPARRSSRGSWPTLASRASKW